MHVCRCALAPGVGAGPPGLDEAILVPGTQPAMQYSRLRLQAPPARPWVGRRENGTYDPSSSCLPQRQAGRAGGEPGRQGGRASAPQVPSGASWCCAGAVPSAVSTRTAWTIAGWKAEAWWKGFAVAQNTSSKQGMIRATQQAVCPSPQGVSGEGVQPAEAPGPPRLCRAPLLWGRGPGVLSEQGSGTHADGGGEAGGPLIHGTCVFPGWVGLRLMQIVSFPCKITLGQL